MKLILIYLRFIGKRLVFVLYAALFVFIYYSLRRASIDFYYISIANPTYNYFSELSLFIYSINLFIIFGLCTVIIEFIASYANSVKQLSNQKRQDRIHKHINETLFAQLTIQNNIESDKIYISQIRKKFIGSYSRLIFINRLRRVINISTGEVNAKCLMLFEYFDVEPLIGVYLKSPYKRHKLFAIKTIGDFRILKFDKRIYKLIRSRNSAVSSESLFAYLKLDNNTNLRFISDLNRQISILEFNYIIQIVQEYKNIDYSFLINSKNVSVSSLGLRLINEHKISGLKTDVIKFINHPNKLINKEAQEAYLSLLNESDVTTLLKNYSEFLPEIKVSCLDLLSPYLKNKKVTILFENTIVTEEVHQKEVAMRYLMEDDPMSILKYKNNSNRDVRNVFSLLTDLNL